MTAFPIDPLRSTYQTSVLLIQQLTVLIDDDLFPSLWKRVLPLDQWFHVGLLHDRAIELLRHDMTLCGRSNDVQSVTTVSAADKVAKAFRDWRVAGIKGDGALGFCFSRADSFLDSDRAALTAGHPLHQFSMVRSKIRLYYRTNDSIVGPSSNEVGGNDAREGGCC